MELHEYLSHPKLKHFIKIFPSGTFLFEQGQSARTMFIILDGKVHLMGEGDSGLHVASIVESGGFLGEKSIFLSEPYPRAFSARAETETTVLELSSDDLKHLESREPETMSELLKKVLKIVDERIERNSYLIRILRSSNNVERLVQLVLYFSRCSGRKFPGGIEVILSTESIHSYIDMSENRISAFLNELVNQRLLVKQGEDRYFIPNEEALLNSVPNLVHRLAR